MAARGIKEFYEANTGDPKADTWLLSLSGFLADKVSPTELSDIAAKSPTAREREDREYQIRFFEGIKCFAAGDRKAGRDRLKGCAETWREGFSEYRRLARRELAVPRGADED